MRSSRAQLLSRYSRLLSHILLSLTHSTASCGMANQFVDEKYSGLEISIRGVLIRPPKKANCDQRYDCSFAI